MNKSNLSVADRGAIDLSGVRAAPLLLMTLFPVDTHLTSDPAGEINEFDSGWAGPVCQAASQSDEMLKTHAQQT